MNVLKYFATVYFNSQCQLLNQCIINGTTTTHTQKNVETSSLARQFCSWMSNEQMTLPKPHNYDQTRAKSDVQRTLAQGAQLSTDIRVQLPTYQPIIGRTSQLRLLVTNSTRFHLQGFQTTLCPSTDGLDNWLDYAGISLTTKKNLQNPTSTH